MRRAIVTGGSGLVGAAVTARLLADGWKVAVMTRMPLQAGIFAGPVRHIAFSLGATDGPPPLPAADALIHCALDHLPGHYRGGEGDDPDRFRRANLDGSIALFRAARDAGIGRVVFLSSRAVYGPQPPGIAVTETAEPHPDTLYGAVKLAAEQALAGLACDAFTPVSIRATGVYGPAPAGRAHKWTGLFRDFLRGMPIAPRCGTEVHCRDLADAVARLLDARAAAVAGRAFNVSDILLDRQDLLRLVAAQTGTPHPLPARADPSGVAVMDTSAMQALGWQPGGWPLLRRTVRELVADR